MYLTEHKTLRLTTLCALYMAQGIPWGFVTVTFAAWLAQPQHGLTVQQIGPMLAVASLPWSFKFLWGPLMDRFTIPAWGKRRPWILFAQSMAILVLSSMLLFENLPGMVWTQTPDSGPLLRTLFALVPGPLALLILTANLFVSMQDVAVDALAVDLLSEKERGIANGLMYGSSYLGTAIGGAGLGWLVSRYGIQAGVAGQALLMLLIMILPLVVRERRLSSEPGSKAEPANLDTNIVTDPQSTDSTASSIQLSESANHSATSVVPHSIWSNLRTAFRLRSARLGVVVALASKVGIGVLTAVFVDYLQKEGGWTLEQYTLVTGGYAVVLGLAGSAVGGLAADRFGARSMIVRTSIALGILWVLFGLSTSMLSDRWLMTGLLMLQEFLLAVMSVALFAMFMSISWPKVAATQFTAYMAMLNLSTTLGSYLAGQLSQSIGISHILIVAGVLQAAIIIPVLYIDPTETRRILGTGE